MGGHGNTVRMGMESALKAIDNPGEKYLIKLIGTDITTNEPKQGGYRVLQELDEEKIRSYAIQTAEENNIKLSKIEILSIKLEPVKEIKL
jgi:hypothetical protein